MDINHISVSRRDCWESCKQKYKYRYHLKVELDEPEKFHFTYGKIVHKIAETYVEHRGSYPLNELVQDVLKGDIEIEENKVAPELPREYKEKLPRHIKAFKKLTDQIGTDGICEYKFEYDLEPPNNYLVTGFIDRLINKNGKFFIIDYKTTKRGKWRKTPQTIVHDLQLRCYGRVVQKAFNVPADKIMAALYYFEGEEIVSTRFTEKSLEEAEKELLRAYKEIKDFPPEKAWGTTGDHCNLCDYKKICPFYNKKVHTLSSHPLLT